MRHLVLLLALTSPLLAQEPPTTVPLTVPLAMDVELLAGAQRALAVLRGQPDDVDKLLAKWASDGLSLRVEESVQAAVKQEQQRLLDERDPELAAMNAYVKYRAALANLAAHRAKVKKEKEAAAEAAKATPTPSPSPTPTSAPALVTDADVARSVESKAPTATPDTKAGATPKVEK